MYKLLITQKKTGQSLCVRGNLEQIKMIVPHCGVQNFNVNSIDKMEKPIEINMRSATLSISKIQMDAGRSKLDLDLIVKTFNSIADSADSQKSVVLDKVFFESIKKKLGEIFNSI